MKPWLDAGATGFGLGGGLYRSGQSASETLERDRCGFLNLGFEYDGQRIDCMEGITVQRVEEALTACIDD